MDEPVDGLAGGQQRGCGHDQEHEQPGDVLTPAVALGVTAVGWAAARHERDPDRAPRCGRSRAALDNGLVIEVEPGRFEEMVVTALDGLPEELGRLMRNVAVTVEHGPGPPGLLGLYQGIPLTSRSG